MQCLPFYDGRGKFSDKVQTNELTLYYKENKYHRDEAKRIRKQK